MSAKKVDMEIDIERYIGIETYITSTPGSGGILRHTPEDFYVEEVFEPKLNENGKYLILKVKKKNWDTLGLARYIAKRLKIGQKRISYAGNKDKRSLSVQYMSIWNADEDAVRNLRIPDVEFEIVGKSHKKIDLGDLKGNNFLITVRNVRNPEVIEKTKEELEIKGLPNFFGHQRFGAQRAVTHEVGKLLIEKKYEDALWCYVGKSFPAEPEDTKKLREEAWNTRDPGIVKEFPLYLRYEKILLQKLLEGKTPLDAVLSLPKNLIILFIHAYQSYLFNRMLSQRIREYGNLKELEVGDVVIISDRNGIMDENKYEVVKSSTLRSARKLVEWKRIHLALPLPGFDLKIPENSWCSNILKEILESEGITLESFNHEVGIFRSKGSYRPAMLYIENLGFRWRIESSDTVLFTFFLPKGSYATSLLREFMKVSPLRM